jgi:DNA-binding CsgD family transcriptional regulator
MNPKPSPRQAEILKLYRAGRNQSEIGRTLEISRQRVAQHLGALRRKGILGPEKAPKPRKAKK